jgi:beta-glucanase (GH16 family)
MEFLSREFDSHNSSFPVNLVLQSQQSANAGFDASRTGGYIRANLPFNPTTGFHEYRFDYLPGQVYFYADGRLLAQMNGSAVPTSAGHLILQHWSNGNEKWSGGPPTEDAILTVNYVKAYFNSSDEKKQRDLNSRCADAKTRGGGVCRIPEVNTTSIGSGGHFFTDSGNPDSANRSDDTKSGVGDGESQVGQWRAGSGLLGIGVLWTAAWWWEL